MKRMGSGFLPVIICVLGNCQASHNEIKKDGSVMHINAQVIEKLAQIDDTLLLRGEESRLLQEGYRAIGDIVWEGIVLRTPTEVNIRQEEDFPIIVASRQTADRGKEVVYGDNAVVISNRRDGEGLWISPVFPIDPRKIPMPPDESGPVPDEKNDTVAEAVAVTSIQRLDLKLQGGMPWEPDDYAARVICYDWLSNVALFCLTDPQATGQVSGIKSAERQKKREEVLAAWDRRSRGKPDRLPNFIETTHSPKVSGIGIALSLPATPIEVGKSIPVYGTACLEAESYWRPTSEGPVAVVSGYIILTRRGILNPIVVSLEVPFYSQDNISTGTPVTGFFAYDLNVLNNGPIPLSLYQVYLVIGEYISGPNELDIRGK